MPLSWQSGQFCRFYVRKTSVKHVFCSLAMDQGRYNVPIINYCENHLLYFHGVPNVCKGFPQRIWHSMIGNMPILNLRYEPLSKVENRFLKRLFDIVLSGIFWLLFSCYLPNCGNYHKIDFSRPCILQTNEDRIEWQRIRML